MIMDRLTEKNYWNSVYEKEAEVFEQRPPSQPTNGNGLKARLKGLLGEYWRNYDEH